MKTKMVIIAVLSLAFAGSCRKYDDQFYAQTYKNAPLETLQNDKEKANSFKGSPENFQITLTWDSSSDLDLFVQDPMGEWIWHKHKKSQSNGMLNHDDRNGRGVETVTWKDNQFPTGNYKVYVSHYGGVSSEYSVQVQVSGKSKCIEDLLKMEGQCL